MVKRFDRLITALAISAVSQVLLFGQGFSVSRPTQFLTTQFMPTETGASSEHIGQRPAPSKTETLLPPPIFQDVAAQRGLTVPHISSPDKKYIVESMSGGVGLFDCDNDDRLDIVVVNGSTIDRFRHGGDLMVTLYHQGTDGKFTDITRSAGLTRLGWGMGVAVADFDNDGRLDLYVTGYGGNALYHNLGNCKFEDVTEKAGVRGGGFSTGAAWGDYDRDGNVDLFVSRYVHVDLDHLPEFGKGLHCDFKGVPVQCGPWGMQGESDLLYHNRGDGTFEEVSVKAGVHDAPGHYGLGVMWGDYDNDDWPDLFVANDSGPNYLYHNNGDGTFTDTAMLGGVAYSGEGLAQGNMGVDFGDYDHRGLLDIFVTTFADQPNALYRNLGAQGFDEVSSTSRIGPPSFPLVGWGTAFFDMDNDGWLDIFVANGHVYPQMDNAVHSAPYRQPMLLYRNNRDGTFDEVSAQAGLGAVPPASRRGAAFGDIFNNGNIDIVVLNVGEPPSLLLNTSTNSNHRVLFKLEGTQSNRAAIGARVTIQAGKLRQLSEVRGGSGYLSQNDLRLHFGLADASNIDLVEIRWPNGKTENLKDLEADYIYTVVEGKGVQAKKALPQRVLR
jgi:enediyne biosynthesis protein E4